MSEKENKIHNVWDKFKLKKDLPTWKVWEEMWIWEDWCLYGTTKEWDVIMVYHVSTLLNFNILNSDWFDKIEETKKSIFDLEETDMFFSIDREGYIQKINLFWISTLKTLQDIWNVFLTEEEAEVELERRKAIQRIKKFMWENNIKNREFKQHEDNYTILYDSLDEFFNIEYYETSYLINTLWYFERFEDCQKIIDNCLDDLKIIYNVKDEKWNT